MNPNPGHRHTGGWGHLNVGRESTFGDLLTGPLTFVSDLLPFTIAGEQYPVCE